MASGKFIAVANMKGGVGKTTTVVTLAECLLAEDPARRVLVVDLDPQASASVTIAGDDGLAGIIDAKLTLEDHIEKRLLDNARDARLTRNIHTAINSTFHLNKRLDVNLLPCGPYLRTLEKRIIYHFAETHGGFTAYEGRLNRFFEEEFLPLKMMYDYVIFDCPPGISALSEVAIRHSDMVIMPSIPDRISVFGLSAFLQTVVAQQAKQSHKPIKPHVLLVRSQNLKKHREMTDALEQVAARPGCGYFLLKTRIPQLASIALALDTDHGAQTTFRTRYPEDMAKHMRNLTQEVTEVCHGV